MATAATWKPRKFNKSLFQVNQNHFIEVDDRSMIITSEDEIKCDCDGLFWAQMYAPV